MSEAVTRVQSGVPSLRTSRFSVAYPGRSPPSRESKRARLERAVFRVRQLVERQAEQLLLLIAEQLGETVVGVEEPFGLEVSLRDADDGQLEDGAELRLGLVERVGGQLAAR